MERDLPWPGRLTEKRLPGKHADEKPTTYVNICPQMHYYPSLVGVSGKLPAAAPPTAVSPRAMPLKGTLAAIPTLLRLPWISSQSVHKTGYTPAFVPLGRGFWEGQPKSGAFLAVSTPHQPEGDDLIPSGPFRFKQCEISCTK